MLSDLAAYTRPTSIPMHTMSTCRQASALAVALIALTLSACGGGSNSAEAPGAVSGSPTSPTVTDAYAKVADESHIFNLNGTAVVRFGDATTNVWITKTVTGYGECTRDFFGGDPVKGTVKTCEAPTSTFIAATTGMTTPMGLMPTVDTSKIPTAWVGSATVRIAATTEIPPSTNSPGGDFRNWCTIAKIAFDDPIALNGQPGKSHLHTFFGNNSVDAYSTTESLRAAGQSTCRGGIANRSSYWVPTMIDTATGAPVLPDGMGPYYKTDNGDRVNALPPGLRMIAGDSTSKVPQGASRFKCIGGPNNENDKYGQAIPDCDAGASMIEEIFFPQCWDGVNLDSPNHKAHMAYSSGGGKCPADHPVLLPNITFNVFYTTPPDHAALKWRLSSDNYDTSLPGGYSGHADWFNAWDKDVSDAWAKGCLQAKVDCHSHLLGDGRMMY